MPKATPNIDLGLALLAAAREPEACFSQPEIAAWCECPHQTIGAIERKVLRKLRRELLKQIVHENEH